MYQNITIKSKFCHYVESFKYHTCNINNSCDYLGSLGLFVASKEAKAITATVTNFGSCFNGSYFIGITSKHSITLEKSLASKSKGRKRRNYCSRCFFRFHCQGAMQCCPTYGQRDLLVFHWLVL
jgi:hypothetical protein